MTVTDAGALLTPDPDPRHLYLQGVYAPVTDELDSGPLAVIGTIPEELRGVFVQNGPNPAFEPRIGHSWFDGDGMVHSVELADGMARYRNRFVQTEGLTGDRRDGRATFAGSLAGPGSGPRHKNVSNTDVVFHAGRLLSLWWEGGQPYQLSVPGLDTLGPCDLDGTLTTGMTSHLKLDPATHELFFFDWSTRAPYLTIGMADAQGRQTKSVPVELPGPRVQHDLALTDTHVIVFDLPMTPDPARMGDETIGFVFRDDLPCRIGLVSRSFQVPPRWFEIEPAWVWHTLCAWDDGDEVVLWGARIPGPTRVDRFGTSHEDRPMVDNEHRFDSHPHEWRLNLRTGVVKERQLDDSLVEFPRVNDANICSGARYGYFAELAPAERTLMPTAVVKYDLATGARAAVTTPARWYVNEPCFASRPGGNAEDDGWILTFVTAADTGRSELWILDASTFDSEPVARIVLPQRKPLGFHTRWIPADPT
jgi:carotenoid cleavage dioxygenase-like enzyme